MTHLDNEKHACHWQIGKASNLEVLCYIGEGGWGEMGVESGGISEKIIFPPFKATKLQNS